MLTVNAALDDPAGTVTLGGTVAGSAADNETTALFAGATAVSVTVPVTELPPTTFDALNDRLERTAAAVTFSVADCGLLPFSVALIVVEPGAVVVTENATLDAPDAIVAGVCTAATPGLLLDSASVNPPAGAADARVMVPWTAVPAGTLVALNEMPLRVVVVAGAAGDDELHAAMTPAKARMASIAIVD